GHLLFCNTALGKLGANPHRPLAFREPRTNEAFGEAGGRQRAGALEGIERRAYYAIGEAARGEFAFELEPAVLAPREQLYGRALAAGLVCFLRIKLGGPHPPPRPLPAPAFRPPGPSSATT